MEQEPILRIKVERIIALKRYEQPPPGYFHLLPDHIINRIEQGEGQSTFWERWCPSFAIRPSLAYALGLTFCGVLTVGIFYAPKHDSSSLAGDASTAGRWAVVSTSDLISSSPARPAGLRVSEGFGSTYPVPAPPTGGIQFETQEARALPVSLFLQN